jgi:integrase
VRNERGIFRRVLKNGDVVYGIDITDPMTHKRYRRLVGPKRRLAQRALDARRAAIAAGKFNVRAARAPITLRQFVDETWRPQVLVLRKPSTQRGYEWMLRHHVLPTFGDTPLIGVTRPAIKEFIARKAQAQHQSRNKTKPANPERAKLAPKTVVNLVSLLGSILASAADDYDLIPSNPAAGLLRRRNIPAEMRPRDRRPHVLEPEDFRRSVEAVADLRVRRMVLFAALTGLRWGELVAVRMEHEVDYPANKLHITRAFYRRATQTPKSEQAVRDVDMSPLVRAILKTVPWTEGLVFSPDGVRRIGEGPWIKRQWYKAQLAARVRHPIRWHDLKHQFVSLLVHAGKNPLYIAEQAAHTDAGFTLRRYAHLFRTIKPVPVEWPEDLVWPPGITQPLLQDGTPLEERR